MTGIEGHLVTAEADITNGLPATILTGLPDTALREARDRIRAAIVNSGETWPCAKITVSVSPASLPKRGSAFDLAIGIAVMAANDALPEVPQNLVFLAELGLDGRLRPVPGVLPAVLAATASGLVDTVVVAAGNRGEASLVPGVTVVGADNLAEVAGWLRGGPAPQPELPVLDDGGSPVRPLLDLADVAGQPKARLAAGICAAGGHNLSLFGPPGAGKTMLAQRLPTILPALDTLAAIEVTSIHSAACRLPSGSGPVTVPPFCAPHHTSSMAAIVGGGTGVARPGDASLAHLGILFLDESRKVLRIQLKVILPVAEQLLKVSVQVRVYVAELSSMLVMVAERGVWWRRATVLGVVLRARWSRSVAYPSRSTHMPVMECDNPQGRARYPPFGAVARWDENFWPPPITGVSAVERSCYAGEALLALVAITT